MSKQQVMELAAKLVERSGCLEDGWKTGMHLGLERKLVTKVWEFQSTLPVWGETANTYSFSARKAVTFAQHRSKFGSREFFPAGEDLLFQRNTEFFSCEPDRKRLRASASHRI